MRENSTVQYTFEDKDGSAETFNLDSFNKIIDGEKVVGMVSVELKGEDESIDVPLLEGYDKPYDWDVTDELGTEHYIYYEETK